MSHRYVFLDTNIILHGKHIEEMAWRNLIGSDEVTFVLPITVIHEIDKQKDRSDERLAKKRAREFNSWLPRYDDAAAIEPGAELPNGARLRILADEPRMSDFPGLDPDSNDDRIVATFLTFAASHADCTLVARDNGIIMKLKVRGQRPIRLPQEMERPPEQDETEKKLAEAHRKLQAIEGKGPKIELSLVYEKQVSDHITVDLCVPILTPPTLIDDLVRARESQMNFGIGTITLAQIHGESRSQHLKRWRKYLEDYASAESAIARTITVSLMLSNTGTAAASLVEVDLQLPEGISSQESGNCPELPKPFKTGAFAHLDVASLVVKPTFNLSSLRKDPDEPEVYGAWVQYRKRDLLHGGDRNLGAFEIVVPESWRAGGFMIRATVRTKELLESQAVELHVKTAVTERNALQNLRADDPDD